MAAKPITREELYELVWTTPMRKLGLQFGVSDVALAKTCARLDVPRPGRGYWAKIAAGANAKRTPLPKARSGAPTSFIADRDETADLDPKAPRAPTVSVPPDLRGAEEAVRRLGGMLASAQPDAFERLVIPGGRSEPAVAVTIATHRRALLLLDGLAKAVRERGHELVVEGGEGAGTATVMGVKMAGEIVPIELVERLDRREHVLSDEDRAKLARGYHHGVPKYDKFACGRLQLTLDVGRWPRPSWYETVRRPLESQLGTVLEAIVEEAARRQEEREAAERQRVAAEAARVRAEEERRLSRIREARARHRQALAADLRTMAGRWSEAQQERRFLEAVKAAVPAHARTAGMVAWLEWADAHVRELDPLAAPDGIPKKLEPEFGEEAPEA